MEESTKQKTSFEANILLVENGPKRIPYILKWKVIDSVDDEVEITLQSKEDVGIPGLDFSLSDQTKYLIAKIFNHL